MLSSGEQENEQILVAANEECKRICEQFPKQFHWMCNVDAKNQTDVYKRILACKESGAVGIGGTDGKPEAGCSIFTECI